jgi:uncharacterized linocin/CFP29 family protein
MMDYLMRDDAPLTEAEWERLDELVVSTARRLLVGRRFIELAGPVGMGTQVVPLDTITGAEACVHDEEDCTCEGEECDIVRVSSRKFVAVPLIHKDFMLAWRDVEAAHQFATELELGPAAAAAAFVARAEDELIFRGRPEHGYPGLLNVEGRQSVPLSDWETSGNALNDVVAAGRALADAGFYAPYALVVSPALHALLQRVYKGSGQLEYKLVKTVADGGIFQSPALVPKQALVISQGTQHLDLAVAQDLVTAYLGPEGMDHRFRALESLVLRLKQPGAVCVLE